MNCPALGNWLMIRSTSRLCRLARGSGPGGRKHPNLLLRDPGTKGDFAVEVFLKSNPTCQFEHAGVLLYGDGDNYVAINKEMFGKPEIVLVAEKAAKPATRQKTYEHEEVYLRLVVTGKKVTGQYRHYDSDAWQTVGELDLPVAARTRLACSPVGRPRTPTIACGSASSELCRFQAWPRPKPKPPNQQPAKEPAPRLLRLHRRSRSIRTDIPLDVQARQTAERAIPYIEKNGTAWIKERNCLACHYVRLYALVVARRQPARLCHRQGQACRIDRAGR